MAFKNEYVLPIEQETSDFLKQARTILRTGFSKYDAWTVDRERSLVLMYGGRGREVESEKEEWWYFLDHSEKFTVYIDVISKKEISPKEISLSRLFRACVANSGEIVTDENLISRIKEALQEYKDWGIISDYEQGQLTLIDARTGKEI